jgi:cytochrome P450
MSQMTSTQSSPTTPRPALPPGPRGHFFWGSLPELQRDMLGLYRNSSREYGDVVRLKFAGVDTFTFSHPDHFKYVLQDNNKNYGRNPFINDLVRMFVGDSLFTTDGGDWLSRRRLMQPAFHRQRIASFGALMSNAAQALLAQWDAAPDGQRLELDQALMALTLRIAGQALFSVDLLGESSALGEGFTGMSEYINYRMKHPFPPPLLIPTKANRLYKHTRRLLDEKIYSLIRQRRAENTDHGDLLGMLMEARDADTGEGMSDDQLHNEIAVMMFAGHETTAATLAWAFYLLSQHSEVEAKLHAELDGVLAGRAPTLDDLARLPYTRQVVDETLRMYPPAFAITRASLGPDVIGGYHFPAKASVTLLTWNAHYDPRFWDNPDRFEPERFTPERSAGRAAFAYLPFGAGPRQCIGNIFALNEAQLVLASLAQRYQFRLTPGHPVTPRPIFVLRTSHGLPMTAHRR